MPKAKVSAIPRRYRYDLLDKFEEEEQFNLSPGILQGGSLDELVSHRTASTSSFSGMATDLLAAVSAVGNGGDEHQTDPSTAWDFSAFHSATTVAAAASKEEAPISKAEERKRLVQDALLKAHESQLTMLSEKAQRQNLSTKRRGRYFSSVVAGEAYLGRNEFKADKKSQAKKNRNKAKSAW